MSFNNESVKHHQGSFNCNVFNWIHYSLYKQYCEIMFRVIQACSVFSLVFPEQQKKKKREQPAFYFFDWSVTPHPLVLSGIYWVALEMFGSSLNFRKASHYRGWKNQWVFFVGGFRCDSTTHIALFKKCFIFLLYAVCTSVEMCFLTWLTW